MIARFAVIVVFALGMFSAPSTLSASQTVMTRRDIRNTPIVQRPSRPGHFYGNTVRRSYQRKS